MPATPLHADDLLTAVLIQLTVIIVAARLFGSLATHLGQPRAVGEMLAGLLLGPSVFGSLFPVASAAVFSVAAAPSMALLSQFGLLLLMFQIGCDFEISQLGVRAHRRAVVYVAVASILISVLVGVLMGRISANALAPDSALVPYTLYIGLAFAVTAVPVLARILHEYSLSSSVPGTIAMTAALGNDVVGWLLLALMSAYVADGRLPQHSLWHLGALLILAIVLWCAGYFIVRRLMQTFPVNTDALPAGWMSCVLALICAAGVVATHLGAFALFGGFLLGLLFRPYATFVKAWRLSIGQFVLVFFLPIFFMNTGLHTNVGSLSTRPELLWCGAFLLAAILSKTCPVYVAARMAGLPGRSAMMVAVMMNTRGLMELIVLNIGLSLGFIPPRVYTMLVIMAIATTMLTGPLLRYLQQKGSAAYPVPNGSKM